MLYAASELIERIKQLNDYKKSGKMPKGFYIVGVRNGEQHPDKFMCHFNLMKNGKIIAETSGTTKPGVSILTGGFKKYNNYGAAVLESDRIYYKVWTPGKHLGRVDALLQRGAKVTVYRDGNMDRFTDETGEKITGWYGINFHIDQFNLNVDNPRANVGNWSAGCQVCNNLEGYKKFIELTKSQQYISYVLLKEFSI